MRFDPPPSLVILIVAAALSAVGLVWALRADRAPQGGRWGPWRLVEAGLGLFFVVGMLYAATTQIVVRYALSDYVTVPWTEEFARLFLVWTALWGAAIVQRSDDHICVAVLFDWLPRGLQRAVRLFGDLVALAVLGLIAWYGWNTAYRQRVMSTVSLGLPIAFFILPVAIGATLMIGHTMGLVVRRLQGRPIPAGEVEER
jgi:TRAP-type C4-dicarboxylate transport system permease small subunit